MGGSEPQQPTFIQPPPPQIVQGPQPNAGQTASEVAQAQLQYNPQLTQQAVQLQQQYAPQLAQSEYNLQAQYGPMYRALYEQMFPSQTQGLETLAQQANQRLTSPTSLTPEQQLAQDTIRNREMDRLQRGIRTQANVGGTLYGGNRERREIEAGSELANQYAMSDIQLQQQQRAQTLQELISAGQVVFPQIQQPGVPNYSTNAAPSADALLNAYQNSTIVNPAVYQQGSPGQPSWLGSFASGFGA